MEDIQRQILAEALQDALVEAHPNVVVDIKGCLMLVDIVERIALAAK